MRLIDADKLKSIIADTDYDVHNGIMSVTGKILIRGSGYSCQCIRDIVDSMSSVDPVRHGRWINPDRDCHCSECEKDSLYDWKGRVYLSDYCPYCGARMDGDYDDT